MRPDPLAQHAPRPLTVSPGFSGYRLALAGGSYFEPIEEFASEQAAWAAKREAERLLATFLNSKPQRA